MSERGHRALAHTADIRLHAWAATREECVAEAVTALVETFANTTGAPVQWTTETELAAEADEDLLVAALDEVIYLVDTQNAVPVETRVERGGTGWRMRLGLAPMDAVVLRGAAPKAVTLSGLRFGSENGGWSCMVIVDV